MLTFGCESHRLADWDALHDDLAATHEPRRAAEMSAITRAVAALAALIPAVEAGKETT